METRQKRVKALQEKKKRLARRLEDLAREIHRIRDEEKDPQRARELMTSTWTLRRQAALEYEEVCRNMDEEKE